jgi:hypothetical protein
MRSNAHCVLFLLSEGAGVAAALDLLLFDTKVLGPRSRYMLNLPFPGKQEQEKFRIVEQTGRALS